MDKKVNGQKVKAFFKRNVYYLIMLVALLAIAALITVAVLTTRNNDGIGDDPSGPAVNTPDDGNDTPATPDDKPDTPATSDPIVFIAPVNGGTLLKDYSMDMIIFSSTLKQYMTHDGIDFGGEEGAKVVAVYGGEVEKVSYDALNGYRVVINHGDGLRTVYASLGESPVVAEGQRVNQGDQIGVISASATSEMLDGAHLHFTVTLNNKTANPYDYLPISWEK